MKFYATCVRLRLERNTGSVEVVGSIPSGFTMYLLETGFLPSCVRAFFNTMWFRCLHYCGKCVCGLASALAGSCSRCYFTLVVIEGYLLDSNVYQLMIDRTVW